MNCKIQELKIHLNKLTNIFESVNLLANSHFGSFFTENVWSQHVPKGIQKELNETKSLQDFIRLYPEIINNDGPVEFALNHPNLVSFLRNVTMHSISKNNNWSSSLLNLENLLVSKGCSSGPDFSIRQYMSKKKLHEVRVTGKVTAFLADLTKTSHTIDIGGGKGYLSSILAFHYSHKVLSLEASQIKSCGAMKMSEKMVRQCIKKHFLEKNDESPANHEKRKSDITKNHCKFAVMYVTPLTNVKEILQESFHEEINGITITGLHTCGNLAPTSLEIFLNNRDVKSIINVGCCYHHITEKFSGEKLNVCEDNNGFPMSEYLKEKKFKLGRNARMLASYSLEKIDLKSVADDFSINSLFFRAILETVVKTANGNVYDRKQVGRLAKKCKNFHEYIVKALKKLNVDVEVTEKNASELYNVYIDKKQNLTAFFLLRISLASLVESIILLDRCLYLLENGINQTYLVKLFDLNISPRGFGIVAWKEI